VVLLLIGCRRGSSPLPPRVGTAAGDDDGED
jgi:hypothetical protein